MSTGFDSFFVNVQTSLDDLFRLRRRGGSPSSALLEPVKERVAIRTGKVKQFFYVIISSMILLVRHFAECRRARAVESV